MVLAGSGAIEHDKLVEAGETLFAKLQKGTEQHHEPARFAAGEIRSDEELEQAHLTFAFPGRFINRSGGLHRPGIRDRFGRRHVLAPVPGGA